MAFLLPLRSCSLIKLVIQHHLLTSGLSKQAPTEETVGMHQQFQGTPDYASTRGLLNKYQGACDDLEALAYCLLELWNGELRLRDDIKFAD